MMYTYRVTYVYIGSVDVKSQLKAKGSRDD